MESPGGWGQSLDDALPSTTAFVVPGQEDLFLRQAAGANRLYGEHGGGGFATSPGNFDSTWPGYDGHGHANPVRHSHQDGFSPQQPNTSYPQDGHIYDPAGVYPYQSASQQQQHASHGLAALDLTGPVRSPSPNYRQVPQGSPPVQRSSPASGQGFPPQGEQWAQPRAPQQYQSRNHRGGQELDARFAAAASGAEADAPAGFSGRGGNDEPYYQQYQRQRHAGTTQPGAAMPHRPTQQQPQGPWAGAGDAVPDGLHGELSLRGSMVREHGWGANNAPAAFAPSSSPTPPGPSAGSALPSAPLPQSPSYDSGFGLQALAAVVKQHGAVRHVVDELRTSPLHPSAASETPARGGGGGRSGPAGGSAVPGGGSSEKDIAAQRYQAQILSLERHNGELQRRVSDLQAALEAAQQSRQALEAKQDDLKDQVAQANSNAKARESALEAGRAANDALSTELRSCQEELASVRDALAASKDTAVQWQDRAVEAAKELEAAKKKIEALFEDERRLSAENMALRKEVQQLNDVIIKGRIETSELREKLRLSQQDTARAASTAQALASRAESEQEGAAVQLGHLRNRVVELEARNGQLQYDLAGLREEAALARRAEEAAKAALAARPAGIMSDLDPSARQHGTLSHAWHAPSGAAGRHSLPSPRAPPSQPESATAAAVLQSLPSNVAFSQLDPETFRSMVRAEAAALAQAGIDAAAAAARPSSPPYPPYGSRYGGSGLGAEASNSSIAAALPPPQQYWASAAASNPMHDSRTYDANGTGAAPGSPTRYGPGNVRESLQALLPDPRSSWVAPYSRQQQPYSQPQQADSQNGGGYGAARWDARAAGTSASASSPPPPYATYTDGSYAFRRPPNAVGAGAAPGKGDSPFGTEETAKEMLARSKALEDQLMVLCTEKGGLEAEYARMPLGAGRNLRERNRKAVVEQRLELLNKEISSVRMQLKRLGMK